MADWLSVQVTQEQAVFSTVEEGRQYDLRDFAAGLFTLLPETPIDANGINADTHFRLESETVWHQFGDRFLPKEFWEPLFTEDHWKQRSDGKRVGMRSMTVEVNRQDSSPGYVRTELGPSVRVTPNGIFAGINCHYQLTTSVDKRKNAMEARRVLLDEWETARGMQIDLVKQLLEAV